MTSTTETRVDQKGLARDLGLTDRRIRQLVEEHILPAAGDAGYELEVCRDRYELYTSGTDREWDRLYDEAEEATRGAAAAIERALSDRSTLDDVKAASSAVQASTSLMMFITACRSKSDAERRLFFPIWQGQEDQCLSQLVARAATLMGATHIVSEAGERIQVAVDPPLATMSAASGGAATLRKARRARRPAQD